MRIMYDADHDDDFSKPSSSYTAHDHKSNGTRFVCKFILVVQEKMSMFFKYFFLPFLSSAMNVIVSSVKYSATVLLSYCCVQTAGFWVHGYVFK